MTPYLAVMDVPFGHLQQPLIVHAGYDLDQGIGECDRPELLNCTVPVYTFWDQSYKDLSDDGWQFFTLSDSFADRPQQWAEDVTLVFLNEGVRYAI